MITRRRFLLRYSFIGALVIPTSFVVQPVRADSIQTLERAPIAVRDVCQTSPGIEGCHVQQALSHGGKLYFLVNGSHQSRPFSAVVTTSEEGEDPTVIPLGPLNVTSFALDSRNRLAYLVKLDPGIFSEFAIHLRGENDRSDQSRKVPNLSGEMRLASNGLGIIVFGIGQMIPLLYDGTFVDAKITSPPAELGQFLVATRFGQEQFAFISQMTGVTQLYSGNAFTGTSSKVDFQQIPFPDIQKNLPSMGQPNGTRGLLVDASSSPDGSLFFQLSGYKLNIGAVAVETLPFDLKSIARVYRLQLGTSDRLKSQENPTGQIFPVCLVATSKTLILSERTSGTFAVYRR